MKLSFQISLVSASLLLPAAAVVSGPYTVDADTVHLFHFDEAAGASVGVNAVPAASPVIAFNGNPALNHATNPQPVDTTVLGAAGASAFGNAAVIPSAGIGLGLDGNGSGGFQMGLNDAASPDAVLHSSLAGADGSFTLEAMVKLSAITGSSREIICTDNSFVNGSRGFQFRINTTGQLEFNFIGTNTSTSVFAIPTTGTHGFVANEWFHVALAFTGSTNTSTFYWTRVDPAITQANAIGTSTNETTSGAISGPLVIGNEARSSGGGVNSAEALLGTIDEVRISKIARAAADFIFEPIDLETNTDNDLLPDYWEYIYFPGNLIPLSGLDDADYDNDGATDLEEFNAGSSPVNPLSTPADTDADTLPDSWEQLYFGGLSQTATGNPDGDGQNNATERANGSAPNNRASDAADIDGEGLPDAWENQYFGSLDLNAGSDPDGDKFGNLQEYQASTNPSVASSRPAGTAVKLVPLDDGNHATSEFGFAGASAINSVSFVRSSLKTVGNQQFITWYGRHQYDAAAAFNNTIWIGRRTVGSSQWEVFRHSTFTANNINDGHDVISYGIDGDGIMHVSWGMHGDAFHYSKSTTTVLGADPIILGPDTTMTGREDTVTYPQFLKLPDGDLLFIFREGASGNGDTFLNRYDTATDTWDNVHRSGNTQLPFIKGTGWTPNYNPYPNMPQLGGADGDDLLLTWCWRYEPVGGDSPANENGYQTNNNIAFGRSTDAGLTWQRHNGTPYVLPISRNGESGNPATAAEHIFTIPEGSSLINQASTCLDGSGNPVVASWWAAGAPANHRRQYMVGFRHQNGTWQPRPVSSRNINPTGTKYDENFVRNLGRPIVVNDDADRVIVAYRDNDDFADDDLATDVNGITGADNGITISHSLPLAQDPDRSVWVQFDLTRDNLGNYEPIIDNELWDSDRQLHFLYQASAGEGYTPPDNTASRFSVLEWDAATYFNKMPQPSVAFSQDRTQITISCPSEPSWSYRLWSCTDFTDWEVVETRTGTGQPLDFTGPVGIGDTKRFWRVELKEGGF